MNAAFHVVVGPLVTKHYHRACVTTSLSSLALAAAAQAVEASLSLTPSRMRITLAARCLVCRSSSQHKTRHSTATARLSDVLTSQAREVARLANTTRTHTHAPGYSPTRHTATHPHPPPAIRVGPTTRAPSCAAPPAPYQWHPSPAGPLAAQPRGPCRRCRWSAAPA